MQTFLFTDIADSTRLWQQFPQAMSRSLAAHDRIMTDLIPAYEGRIVKSTGDGVHAAFEQVRSAAQAAVAVQQALQEQSWEETGPLLVRMGLHTGDAEWRDGDYYGTAVNKAARVMAMAHGGQVLLSDVTFALLQENAPQQVGGRELGRFRMKGLGGRTALFQLTHPNLPDNFPALSTADAIPHNLPERMTSFIGRQQEMDRIVDLLVDTETDPDRKRLVTLIGPGGTGKTRLSIHAARQVKEAFPDGVWLIELAALTDPQAIPQAVLDVMVLKETPETPAVKLIGSYLKERQALLIFDNCEHLVEASARLIDQILRAAPMVQVLASSREALGTYGETVLRIPSLPLPELESNWEQITQSEAVQLFTSRAETAGAGRWMTPENGPAIAQICRRLDGIPLALEMAAARLRVFSPAQILERLDDRFRLLTGGSRTALPRLQTLQALIDWSYDLLEGDEKALLQELSVFSGGWTIEMALEVCPERDVLTLLPLLVEKSLVVAEPGEDGMKYAFLETMRQYARDRLMESGRTAEVRDRHLAFFIRYTRFGDDWEMQAIDRHVQKIGPYLENIRAAMTWGLDTDPWAALDLVSNVITVWQAGLVNEGLAWANQALEKVETTAEDADGDVPDPERKRILTWAYFGRGALLFAIGRNRDSYLDSQKSLALARETEEEHLITLIQSTIALACIQSGDFDQARRAIEEGLELAERQSSRFFLATLINIRGLYTLSAERDIPAARNYLEQAMKIDPSVATSITGMYPLIKIENMMQNFERARQLVEIGLQAVEESSDMDKRRNLYMYQSERGHIERLSGNLDAALHIYGRMIQLYREFSMEPAIANLLECFAMIAVQKGQLERASRLFGVAEALRERNDADMTVLEHMEYSAALQQLKSQIEAAELEAAWQQGRSDNLDRAIGFALQYAEFGI